MSMSMTMTMSKYTSSSSSLLYCEWIWWPQWILLFFWPFTSSLFLNVTTQTSPYRVIFLCLPFALDWEEEHYKKSWFWCVLVNFKAVFSFFFFFWWHSKWVLWKLGFHWKETTFSGLFLLLELRGTHFHRDPDQGSQGSCFSRS